MKFSNPTVFADAKVYLICVCFYSSSMAAGQFVVRSADDFDNDRITVAAERTDLYMDSLKGKRVAVITNQTGRVGELHLVDTLLSSGVQVTKVFAPEHGFRGTADAGEVVRSGVDVKTGVPVVSLYGSNKKPTPEMLKELDLLLFDIQDVGARFYTYISTMHYCMEAAAESNVPFMVLDRPNPNGFYFDGPVLEPEHRSFVGMHPIPIVHGLTVGELANLINEEGWLKDGAKCELTVIPCAGYRHDMYYELPVRPSPNLPNMTAVYLYPSLCLFEGTDMSVGRGTDWPFQCVGHPELSIGTFSFTPESRPGAANPPHKGSECQGFDLRKFGSFYFRDTKMLHLEWLIGCYADRKENDYFNSFFSKLAGTSDLRLQIEGGSDVSAIRSSWEEDLRKYGQLRDRYLLYPER